MDIELLVQLGRSPTSLWGCKGRRPGALGEGPMIVCCRRAFWLENLASVDKTLEKVHRAVRTPGLPLVVQSSR